MDDKNNHVGKVFLIIISVVVAVILIGGVAFRAYRYFNFRTDQPVCAQDVKPCPNGTYVSREGPNCEFGTCPDGISLPDGYTLDAYRVATTTDIPCVKDRECKTPAEYQMLSNCPYTSICISEKCAVVCPAHIDLSWKEVEAMVQSCDVKRISQFHNRLVTVTLEDGRQFQTIEPVLDQVLVLADSVKNKCGQISISTE